MNLQLAIKVDQLLSLINQCARPHLMRADFIPVNFCVFLFANLKQKKNFFIPKKA